MNEIILKILKENYSIENNGEQWIYTDEQGASNILTDADILAYDDYIRKNISDFGYTDADISSQNSTSEENKIPIEENKIPIEDNNGMLSTKELMKKEKLKLKEGKKAAKLLKKQQKIEAKKAKKEAKKASKEELIIDQNYDDSLKTFSESNNVDEVFPSENLSIDSNNIINESKEVFENSEIPLDTNNVNQSEQTINNNSEINKEYPENNNNSYYGYDYNNEIKSISKIKESCNSEITIKIANNIEDTQKSISRLRELFDESK
ncbi:MAG: hypothetical protein ACRDCG_02570 [Mycoplasmoidaceae bacterium]